MMDTLRPIEPLPPERYPKPEEKKPEKVVTQDEGLRINDNVNWFDLLKLWVRENLINDILKSQTGERMENKLWYTSKTFWVNIIGLVWMFIGPMIGIPTLDTETMATILGVINVILRFVTKAPVTLK